MKKFFSRSWLKALSGLFVNLAAAWFAVAFITPNFSDPTEPAGFAVLGVDILLGFTFLVSTVKLEEVLEK